MKKIKCFLCVLTIAAAVMLSFESAQTQDDKMEEVEKILEQLREVDGSAEFILYS